MVRLRPAVRTSIQAERDSLTGTARADAIESITSKLKAVVAGLTTNMSHLERMLHELAAEVAVRAQSTVNLLCGGYIVSVVDVCLLGCRA